MSFTPDIFPNELRFKAVQPSADGYVEIEIPTGLGALASNRGKGKRIAIQVLGITTKRPQMTDNGDRIIWHLRTFSSEETTGLHERGIIFDYDNMLVIATNGIYFDQRTEHFDFGVQGLGILVATDKLYFAFDTISYDTLQAIYGKIFYKYVEIGLEEYADLLRNQMQYGE